MAKNMYWLVQQNGDGFLYYLGGQWTNNHLEAREYTLSQAKELTGGPIVTGNYSITPVRAGGVPQLTSQ